MDQSQYRLIYEYFASRIRFGYYKRGDRLPSLDRWCQKFFVSRQTMRSAFLQLQEDGFLSVSPGRQTTVVYDASDGEIKQNIRAYYLARRAGLEDLYRSTALYLNPLLREGCALLKQTDLKSLEEAASQPETEASYLSLRCCYTMLGRLNNPLAMNLFSETVLYYQFPCFQGAVHLSGIDPEPFSIALQQVAACCGRLDRDGLWQAFLRLQELYQSTMAGYLSALPDGDDTPQIPFQWQVYRDRPQCCYSLVSLLIRGVVEGIYQPGTLLPSYGEMAREHGVSVSTARRCVSLLNGLGITRTSNGVGTQVMFSAPDLQKLRRPAVYRNFDILCQSLQIVNLTCGALTDLLFSAVSRESLLALRRDLEHALRTEGLSYLLFFTMSRLLKLYPPASVREISSKLYGFLLWGYPFIQTVPLTGAARGAAGKLIQGLADSSPALFSGGLRELFSQMAGHISQALQMPLL